MTPVRILALVFFLLIMAIAKFGVYGLIAMIGPWPILIIGIPLMIWGFHYEWKHHGNPYRKR